MFHPYDERNASFLDILPEVDRPGYPCVFRQRRSLLRGRAAMAMNTLESVTTYEGTEEIDTLIVDAA